MVNGTMIVNDCTLNTPDISILYTIAFLLCVLYLVGFKIRGVGLLASIGFIILSWFIVGCQGSVGYIVALFGLLSLLFFTFKNS